MTLPAPTINTAKPSPRFSSRQRHILLVLLGAGFMLSVDFSILNVALPQAGRPTAGSGAPANAPPRNGPPASRAL